MKNRIMLMLVKTARKYRVNQKYKDRVFRMIFHDKKDLLSLYNAVNGTTYTNPGGKAVVLNINEGHNTELMDKCGRLEAYAYFVSKVRTYLATGYTLDIAIDYAIDDCIANDKLTDILAKNRAEVKNMLLTDFNEKKYRKMIATTNRAQGQEEGRVQGRAEGKLLTVRIFRTAQENPDFTPGQIAEEVGCSAQEAEDTLKMFGI